MKLSRPGTQYSSWSIDALKGYVVMLDALTSGTLSQPALQGYAIKAKDVKQELDYRVSYNDSIETERTLAFPTETAATGSFDR